jgi:hypothetical protein
MKQITFYACLLITVMMMVSNPINAQKSFIWEMPEKLTGNEDFDTYLLTCDTLWNRIQSYNEQIIYYKVAQAPTGEVDDTGNPIYKYMVIDDEGNPYKTLQVISQYADWIMSGSLIVLQCTTLSLMTASATTSLPKLGLKAFSYAKYVQAGPKIVSLGVNEIKEMNAAAKKQGAAIKALKKASTNTAENKDAVMLTSDVPEGVEIVQMTSEELDELAANAMGDDVNEEDLDLESIFE